MSEYKARSPVKSLFKIISKDASKVSQKELSSKENRPVRNTVTDKRSSASGDELFPTLKKSASSAPSHSRLTANSPAPSADCTHSATPLTLLNRDVTYDGIHSSGPSSAQTARQRATVMFDTDDGGQFVVSYDAPRSNSHSRVNTSLNDSHSLPQAAGKSDGGSILRVAATFSDETCRDSSIKKLGIGDSEAMTSRTSRRLEATFIQEDCSRECACSNSRGVKHQHHRGEDDSADKMADSYSNPKSKKASGVMEKAASVGNLLNAGQTEDDDEFDDIFNKSGEEDLDQTFNCEDDDEVKSFASDDARSERSTSNYQKPSKIASYTKNPRLKSDIVRRSSLSSLGLQNASELNALSKATSFSRIPVLKGIATSSDRLSLGGRDCKPAGQSAANLKKRLSLSSMPKVANPSSKLARVETLPSKPKFVASRSVDRDNPGDKDNPGTVRSTKITRSASGAGKKEPTSTLNTKPPVKPRRVGDRANTSNTSICSVGNVSISSVTSIGSTTSSAERKGCGSASTISSRQKIHASNSEPRFGTKGSPAVNAKTSQVTGNTRKVETTVGKQTSAKKQEMSMEGNVRNVATGKLTVGQFQKRKEYDPKKAIQEARSKGKPPSGNRSMVSVDGNESFGNMSLRSFKDTSFSSSWRNSSVTSEPAKPLKSCRSNINLNVTSESKKVTRTASSVTTVRGNLTVSKAVTSKDKEVGKKAVARGATSTRSRLSSCNSDTSTSSVSSSRGTTKSKNAPEASQSFCAANKSDQSERKPYDENSLEIPNWALEFLNDLSKSRRGTPLPTDTEAQGSNEEADKGELAQGSSCQTAEVPDPKKEAHPEDSLDTSRESVDSSADNFSKRVHKRASLILQQIQNGGLAKTAESFFNTNVDTSNLNSSNKKDTIVKKRI